MNSYYFSRRVKNSLVMCLVIFYFAWPNVGRSESNFISAKPTARVEHWKKREDEINKFLQESKNLNEIKLLFVGDSITDFWLLDESPWVSGKKFGRKIWDQSFSKPGSENYSLNIGISGDRTEHVLYRILPKAKGGMGQLDPQELKPEFIVLLLGINNSWAAESPVVESIYEGVLATITALHAQKPDARIILQSLLPTNDVIKNKDVVLKVNEKLKIYSSDSDFQNMITFLDLYPLFIDADGSQLSMNFTDGLHPNNFGYEIWRTALVKHITNVRTFLK